MDEEGSAIDIEKLREASVEQVLELLGTSAEVGLSEDEAARRLREYGPNIIPEKKVNPILKFLSYFWGPIPWMIEAAAILSFIIQHWADFWIIIALLLVNAIVGFWEEHKAENVIEYLKQRMAVRARVLRDGIWKVVQARELVPGDIIRLRIGDIVPADVKLIGDGELTLDESALTGESLPVDKGAGDIAYSGSIVKRGEMNAIVVATGLRTYFGKTVKLVEKAKVISSLQRMVVKVGNYLVVLALALIGVVIVFVILNGEGVLTAIRYALVLAVASVPAALPAVLSITMAVGALHLARKQAIVTKLVSIEELAGVDILCVDKTGTLTKNKLTIADPIPFNGYSREEVVLYAALASREEDKDPIDLAILGALDKYGLRDECASFRQLDFSPFDPVRKRTEALVERDGSSFRVAKGAPQVILHLCRVDRELWDRAMAVIDDLAEDGFRALGVARTIGSDGQWDFVGIIPLFDPPREDAKEAIEKLRALGLKIKMLTGDHTAIARRIAEMLGLGTKIVPVSELVRKKQERLDELAEEADGFSEVFPEHKYAIVKALQRRGYAVATTGDGVNDAPSLKQAECGIAVAGATDAARAAADIVLLQPGLSVITDAVQEARKIFQRMENYVIYRITETIRVLFFICLSILILNFYPITAIMVVLLAILNDIPILTISNDKVLEQVRPTRWKVRKILVLATVLGLTGVISSFVLLLLADKVLGLDLAAIQTLVFLKLVVAGHSTLFVARTKGPLWGRPRPSLPLFVAVILTDLAATFIAAYGFIITPIGWVLTGLVWAYCLAWMLVNDCVKLLALRFIRTS
ncbi:MAG TPA: plasma-membrane proton-efflux P-type ATPase [Candidatus Bathyarchaeota archaeon]|nr:plasma-membrane proton-efflux P-type ATPase [Candidatus Bathyarchaeota archaeon]